MFYFPYPLIILSCLLRIFNAIEYSQIINATKQEQFVKLTTADFETVEEFENVDIKQVIMDELTKNGEQLTSNVVRFLDNPTGESGKLEGDIDVPLHTNIVLTEPNLWNLAYAAVADSRKLWPNGVIPYLVSSNYGKFARNQIAKAMEHFDKKKTCLNYVARTNETDYLVIRPRIGCSSHVGRMGGRQEVSISAGCTKNVTVVHELMHAAGFYHEQARYDRDNHVIIHLANIEPKPGIIKQFDKQNESVISLLGMPYDQHSIMHYKEYEFSKPPHNLRTISAKNGGQLSNKYGLTDIDVMKINSLYDCVNKSAPPRFDKSKVDHLVLEGKSFILNCNLAHGSGEPSSEITWTFEARNLTTVLVAEDGRKSMYAVSSAMRSHEGKYFCDVTNEAGNDQLVHTVLVMQPPVILNTDLVVLVDKSTTGTLSCRTTGNPMPTITWWHNRENVIDLIKARPGKYAIVGDHMMLNNAEEADVGGYECVAKNLAGEERLVINVDVLFGPSFTEFERSYTINQTDTGTMKCSATSNPEATITWFKADIEISFLEKQDNIILSPNRDTLVIRNATEFDNGTYQCRAHNTIDAIMTDIHLHVLGDNYQPEVTCEIRCCISRKNRPELKRQLINHFTNHHNDDNAIQVAIQIINSFSNSNWFVASCNNNDDVSTNGFINVKVDDRQHMFYHHYNRLTWGDATKESVKLYLNSIQWTIKSAWDVRIALNNHFNGDWDCVISSNNDTIVDGNDINVRLNNDVKFITVFKGWNS